MLSTLISDRKLFSHIYELEKRRSDRDWHSTYLIQIEVGKHNSQNIGSDAQVLIRILMGKIRSEDIIYQWNKNIFLLIICNLEYEDATKIVERISGNYFKNIKRERPGLDIKFWPLESG